MGLRNDVGDLSDDVTKTRRRRKGDGNVEYPGGDDEVEYDLQFAFNDMVLGTL